MKARAAGAGSPIWFNCPVWRRAWPDRYGNPLPVKAVPLTDEQREAAGS